jgi:hypothetical protein
MQICTCTAGLLYTFKNIHTYIDQARVVSAGEVVEHRSLVEKREFSHVLDFVKLGRVHLLDIVPVGLMQLSAIQFHGDFIAFLAPDGSLHEAQLSVRHPDKLLFRPFGLSDSVVDLGAVGDQVLQRLHDSKQNLLRKLESQTERGGSEKCSRSAL